MYSFPQLRLPEKVKISPEFTDHTWWRVCSWPGLTVVSSVLDVCLSRHMSATCCC